MNQTTSLARGPFAAGTDTPAWRVTAGRWGQFLMGRVLPPLIVIGALLALCEVLCSRPGAALPSPSQALRDTWELIADPFYDNGGNDVGMAWQILASLQRDGLRAEHEAESARLERGLQQLGGRTVEQALHDPVGQMHDGHVHAAQAQAVGGLQPEQAGADDDRVAVRAGCLDHGLGVGDVAVGEHAGQVGARHGQDEGSRAGRQQQAVVAGLGAVVGKHAAAHAVDPDHLAARVQRDAVFGVPRQVVEHDVREAHLAGQHRGEQDAVVVAVRFGAEDGDLVSVGRVAEQLLQGLHPGHAVADQYQFLFAHDSLSQQSIRRVPESGSMSSGDRR